MKFAEYRSGMSPEMKLMLQQAGFKDDVEFAKYLLDGDPREMFDNPIMYRHTLFTYHWAKLGRPYYDVYPGIIPPLLKCSLAFPGTMVQKPSGLEHLYLRFPEDRKHALSGETLTGEVIQVRGLILSFQECTRSPGSKIMGPALVIGIDVGEIYKGTPIFTFKIFPLDERNVEDTYNILDDHDSLGWGMKFDREFLFQATRLAVAVCMIQDDPDILEPQVLNRDLGRTGDLRKMLERARKRGKYGFSLGKGMEMVPHIRRPHPALVWTGKGRKIPRIVFRKGSVIHREIVEKIPTGKEVHGDQ